MLFHRAAAALFLLLSSVHASPAKVKRQLPAQPTGVTTITSPNGAEIRYKEPGKEGVCETTPGVKSYSGYVSLNETTNTFFWFFEARKNPATAPITLWLNGGPGSDSLIGLFEELGPCNITEDLKTQLNPYAWNEESNMLFISQPLSVGFSYGTTQEGYQNTGYSLRVVPERIPGVTTNTTGRFAYALPDRIDTTELAAVATWEVLQAFLAELPTLDSTIKNRTFNLWTESYGGHYGPTFFDYFYEQNELIASGEQTGVELRMDSLGIINGIVDYYIQIPYYPEFAVNNTYGIKAYNDSIYEFAKLAAIVPGGCLNQIYYCTISNKHFDNAQEQCEIADNICRNLVEGMYYVYGKRGAYDIRHPYVDPTPPLDLIPAYLNRAEIQQALGVDINYTSISSSPVYYGFTNTGDGVYRRYIHDLERVLKAGLRVAMIYGDADYICNWFGGEAVSLALKYPYSKEFGEAGYAPFVVDGVEYGESRQYGQLSFTRVYEAGHTVPYYQPKASLELFRRVLGNLAVSDGSEPVTPTYESEGKASATHTESSVALPSSASIVASSSARASASTSAVPR